MLINPSLAGIIAASNGPRQALATVSNCLPRTTTNGGKPITPEEAAKFKAAHAAAKLQHPLSHNSYLINLAAPDEVLWEKSIAAMIDELRRADILGIPYVVAHPGAFTSSSEAAGLRRIIAGFDRIHAEIPEVKAGRCSSALRARGRASGIGWST